MINRNYNYVQILNITHSADQEKYIIVQENDDLSDLIGDKSTKLKHTSNTPNKKRTRTSKNKEEKPKNYVRSHPIRKPEKIPKKHFQLIIMEGISQDVINSDSYYLISQV